jgi:WD40 repeat protein
LCYNYKEHTEIFHRNPVRRFEGHTSDILDLSWSKNNFLLSSSTDKTVRLWHVSKEECLCVFQHLDFVPSVVFHPKDDRFFLSGSIDCKMRLWSIPEKRVVSWVETPSQQLITAVGFCRSGKTAVCGTFLGKCYFYDTDVNSLDLV